MDKVDRSISFTAFARMLACDAEVYRWKRLLGLRLVLSTEHFYLLLLAHVFRLQQDVSMQSSPTLNKSPPP